jgi:uroporphyrinogen-III synthase
MFISGYWCLFLLCWGNYSLYCLITRPEDKAKILRDILKEKNIPCLLDPMLTIEHVSLLEDDIDKISNNNYQLIILTSNNSINALLTLTKLKDLKIALVGKESTGELINLGFKNITIIAHDAKILVDQVISKFSPFNGSILYLRGDVTALNLTDILQQADFVITELITYRSIIKNDFARATIDAIKDRKISIVPFFSSRSAENFINLVKKNQLDNYFSAVKAFALSKNIATILDYINWGEIKIANIPTQQELINLFDE